VRVAMLSRFQTTKEQQAVLAELEKGNVDIVIGTHRLLSPDVKFKGLGLIVVDEEHRFGVKHKERLKHLKLETDVLTLTATPIHRTLHMSLAGGCANAACAESTANANATIPLFIPAPGWEPSNSKGPPTALPPFRQGAHASCRSEAREAAMGPAWTNGRCGVERFCV
jgi:hypothetical protein